MRTLTWRMGCVSIALAALVSYPGVSFGVPDCSIDGAFDPPLPFNAATGFCQANGALKSQGSLFVDPAHPLEVGAPGTTITISQQPPRFPFVYLAGSFVVLPGGILSTISPVASGAIDIRAGGDIQNTRACAGNPFPCPGGGGIFSLIAPFDQLRLKATTQLFLQGPDLAGPGLTLLHPSTLLIGDSVKLSSEKGSIIVENTAIVSYSFSLDMLAPRGDVTIHNSILFVLQDRANNIGFCRFQVKTKNHQQIGQVIGLPGTPTEDPTNTFVCLPQIIKG